MKRIQFGLLIICAVLFAQNSFSQKRPFSEFANDTVAYLTYNFYEHQEMYLGQPLEKFFKDFDLEIKSVCLKANTHDQMYALEFCTRPASQIRANVNNDAFRNRYSISMVFNIGEVSKYPSSIPKTPKIGDEVIIDWKDSYKAALKDLIPWMFVYTPETK